MYCALIGYIWYEAEPEEKNFLTLLELINASEAREDDEEFQSPVDLLFAKLEKEHPDHFAVKQYRKFKLAAGKTLKSSLISCGARLASFDIAELREIMSDDELELDTLGDRKTVLFLIVSDTDTTFNFVIAMLQSRLGLLRLGREPDPGGEGGVVRKKKPVEDVQLRPLSRCLAPLWRMPEPCHPIRPVY